MKNLYKGTIIVLVGLLLTPSLNLTKANAAVRYEEIDVLFQETLNGILGYENIEEANISAKKERLYDIELNELGVIYDFTYDEQEGFAIIIDDGTSPRKYMCRKGCIGITTTVNFTIVYPNCPFLKLP